MSDASTALRQQVEAESIKPCVDVGKRSIHRSCSRSSISRSSSSRSSTTTTACCPRQPRPHPRQPIQYTPCVCNSTRHHDKSFRARQQAQEARQGADLHRIDRCGSARNGAHQKHGSKKKKKPESHGGAARFKCLGRIPYWLNPSLCFVFLCTQGSGATSARKTGR